jgi:acetyltransferase-like isoleucine patch superfamily enzyme
VGIYKPVSIYVSQNGKLVIGSDCGFSGTSIHVTDSISIGNYCNFGGNTAIWDNDFHPLNFQERRIHNTSCIASAPIVIGDDVFVGANSIILKGVTIGDRAIIGAGSVVTKDIPDNTLWYGNPATFKGYVCKYGHKLNAKLFCEECGKFYLNLKNMNK